MTQEELDCGEEGFVVRREGGETLQGSGPQWRLETEKPPRVLVSCRDQCTAVDRDQFEEKFR